MTEHYVYILMCNDDSLYTGYTTDIERRVKEHNGKGDTEGAKYTRGRRPVKLVYSESFVTRSEALQREYSIKKLTRVQKLKIFD